MVITNTLREFSEYRIMLAANNAEIRSFLASLNPFRRKEEA